VKRLYCVSWHGCCYVVAESAMEADDIANSEARHGLEEAGILSNAGTEDGRYGIENGWHRSMPFNAGNDTRTVEQWFADLKKPAEEAPR